MRSFVVAMCLVGMSAPAAHACGGFFCAQQPVEQAAEHIVFEVEEGTISMHVQIKYQGTAEEFAWILPVPAMPDLFLTHDELFDGVLPRYQPSFFMSQRDEGNCWEPNGGFATNDAMASPKASDEGVTVFGEERLGPYDTATLGAESTDALIGWLTDNGYDIPSDIEPLLEPYVDGGSAFVALKLASDSDVGDLEPLGMTYPGTVPSVPIQLTSIAAAPDMPLVVTIFSDRRYVPESYLHVVPNFAAVDWFAQGSNYSSVVGLAADEAGGHAFATDFAGDPMEGQISFFFFDTEDVEDLQEAEAIPQRHSYATRLISSLDAAEMTVDPTFVANSEMDEVSNSHSAELVYRCGNGKPRRQATRNLVLEDGKEILIPSERWFEEHPETSPSQMLTELAYPNAETIDETGTGAPSRVTDNTAAINAVIDDHNASIRAAIACGGCAMPGTPAAWWPLILMGLAGLRRRD